MSHHHVVQTASPVMRCSPTLQEKFQPYFADAGYDSWAVSLRGQGGSDPVQGSSVAGTLPTLALINQLKHL